MKYNEIHHMTQKPEPKPDTYEAGMAQNQLLKIGTHAIKIHNMIDDDAEMEAWVAKKIDLASNYVKSVHGYTAGSKAGTYDDGGMTEDTPFGSGMDLVRMAVLRKFISAEEYMAYAKELKAAGEEVAQNYDDWPEGEGFGSSDGNFAIKDLMTTAGYEFDEQDKGGRFIVTKMPEKLEKMGIKNVRMRDAVTSEDADIDANFQSDVLNFLNSKVIQIEKQIESKPALTAEEKENKEFALKLFDFVQKKLEQKDDNTPLEVPKSMIKTEEKGKRSGVELTPALKQKVQAWWDKWNQPKYEAGNSNTMAEGYLQYHMNTGIGSDFYNADEMIALKKKYGEDFDESAHMDEMPLTRQCRDEIQAITGKSGQDSARIVQDVVKYFIEKEAVTFEDAGEGHMSKSQLYQTAKMAIELLDMIKKGDDLEGWVQTKLNLAADYLQAVYHYEDYQKLNPYREELDANIIQRHAGIIQKHLDEILERKCRTEDIDTKPGMMRILKKRVNEVEKEIAKENRKDANEGDMEQDKENPIAKPYINKPEWKALHDMDDKIIHAYIKHKKHKTNESGILYRAGVKKYGKAGMKAIQSAAAKGASHQEIGKIKDKHLKDSEVLDEGLKDWARNLAMAGVVVAGLAGVGSIQDAIDRSVPAVQAMETALELAQDQGNDELAKMIKDDLSAVKVRLSSGKDLNFVKDMQAKYSKFVKTEGLAYESKLAIMLTQQIK